MALDAPSRRSREFALQESLTLSHPPASPDLEAAAGATAVSPMAQLATQVQTLRNVVSSQQAQLQALQQQQQAQPMVGWTTDSPWGLALEGLVMGAAALGLGALSIWAWHTSVPRGVRRRPAVLPPASAPAGFSDSMLYLADQEEAQGRPVAVSARLHDPRYDSRGKVVPQDDDDAELDYYRMALTQQGLSVTDGAGQVDSARMPLDAGPTASVGSPSSFASSAFGSRASGSDFDERAAAEEVERVRRYLAQRRADRARGPIYADSELNFAPSTDTPGPVEARRSVAPPPVQLAPTPTPPVAWEDLLPSPVKDAAHPSDQVSLSTPPGDEEVLEHTGLAQGASLLAALTDEEPAGTHRPVDGAATSAVPADDSAHLLEWSTSDLLPVAEFMPAAMQTGQTTTEELGVPLPSAAVQLQLALEFRDLGLWDEARERVLEVLAQPDDGHHSEAQALLEELSQTAPAPLGVEPQLKDPWGHPGEG